MGKKAVIGTSPKDSSIDKMDRYIQRNERKEQQYLLRNGKKDLSKIPMDEWPLEKQLEFLNNRSDADKFKEKYSSYSFLTNLRLILQYSIPSNIRTSSLHYSWYIYNFCFVKYTKNVFSIPKMFF